MLEITGGKRAETPDLRTFLPFFSDSSRILTAFLHQ